MLSERGLRSVQRSKRQKAGHKFRGSAPIAPNYAPDLPAAAEITALVTGSQDAAPGCS